MRKIFFIFFFILFLNKYTGAQEFNAGGLSGLSTSQVSGDNLGGFNKAGIILGGFVNRKINTSLA